MCKWGTNVLVRVVIPARLSHTGEDREDVEHIDACIAPIVRALNADGIRTDQSCCGHGKADGYIDLNDGRKLIVRAKEVAALRGEPERRPLSEPLRDGLCPHCGCKPDNPLPSIHWPCIHECHKPTDDASEEA